MFSALFGMTFPRVWTAAKTAGPNSGSKICMRIFASGLLQVLWKFPDLAFDALLVDQISLLCLMC